MGRKRRVVGAGAALHVWQRGNHQAEVFGSDAEHRMFLSMLLRECALHRVRVAAYCLMTNHYHLVAVGEEANSISRAVGRTNQDYSLFRHSRDGKRGQLWQGRFRSAVLDDAYFWAALCYVERNPVEAGLVNKAQEWPWSSARAHLGLSSEPLLDFERWGERYEASSWERALEIGIYDSALEQRLAIGKTPVARHPGKVLVDEAFADGEADQFAGGMQV